MMREKLEAQLRGDEGNSTCVYRDNLGYWTIGVGRLVDARKPGSGLRPVEVSFMLQNDIEDRINELDKRLPWFKNLDEARRGVLLNMAFQMGVVGLMKFETTLKRVESGDYTGAKRSMLQSLWAQQTPARAARLAKQMETGQWQFAPGV
jgi:lysozyme